MAYNVAYMLLHLSNNLFVIFHKIINQFIFSISICTWQLPKFVWCKQLIMLSNLKEKNINRVNSNFKKLLFLFF